MTLIDSLNWRYSTKKFDITKKITTNEFKFLRESIRLAASSYGLQPYKVLVVENKELKEKLRPASFQQPQITDASHIFIFCNSTDVSPDYIDNYVGLISEVRSVGTEHLQGYSNFMKSTIGQLNPDQMSNWTAKQAYIAMGNLLLACAELKIDACPIEGFEKDKYNTILDLSSQGLEAAVVVAVGHRSEEDESQSAKKVRLAASDLFI